MKLLVVEDEHYTLQGVVGNLDLATLGITELETATDGRAAVERATAFVPDIVLSDVRMPHIDGVEMAKLLRDRFPSIKIIFMSGYADKEYLKAAIDLGAVSYIEKPVEMAHVTRAVRTAVMQITTEQVRSAVIGAGTPAIEAELARRLVETPQDGSAIIRLIQLTASPLGEASRIVTAVARLEPPRGGAREHDEAAALELLHTVRSLGGRAGLNALAATRPDATIVVHLFASGENARFTTGHTVSQVLRTAVAASLDGRRLLAGFGNVVRGWAESPTSYSQALKALERAFFEGYGCAVPFVPAEDIPRHIDEDVSSEFARVLASGDADAAVRFIARLGDELRRPPHPTAAEARRLFRRLLARLVLHCEEHGIRPPDALGAVGGPWDRVDASATLDDVVTLLAERTRETLTSQRELKEHGRVVAEIRRYILQNFHDPAISVETIAHAVNLSAPYACTRFKASTGKTINGYLTEVRLARARELLADPDGPNITEVAALVGWTNADYFARVFRKLTSRSPSEFRGHLRA